MKKDSQPVKLNLGAGPIWQKNGWHALDHKLKKSEGGRIAGDATNMDLPDESCSVVFCSHVFEHIPHVRLPIVIAEINRVLIPGGILRLLTPDLELLANAYVKRDAAFFEKAKEEDESLRTDLGYGGMLVNFIVSPGQDTVLLDRGMQNFIAGYAHLYSYDYEMLAIMLSRIGFVSARSQFNGSRVEELREPLHVVGHPPVWETLNQKYYRNHGLVHKLVDGKYQINFTLTGFDRDPLTSLIIEAEKKGDVSKQEAHNSFNLATVNYNRYAFSLLTDETFRNRLDEFKIRTEWNF